MPCWFFFLTVGKRKLPCISLIFWKKCLLELKLTSFSSYARTCPKNNSTQYLTRPTGVLHPKTKAVMICFTNSKKTKFKDQHHGHSKQTRKWSSVLLSPLSTDLNRLLAMQTPKHLCLWMASTHHSSIQQLKTMCHKFQLGRFPIFRNKSKEWGQLILRKSGKSRKKKSKEGVMAMTR